MSSREQTSSTARASGVEALRVVSAIGIIFFHAGATGASVGYAGLPCFLVVSVAVAARRSPEDAREGWLGQQLRRRADRLLLPWLFWCAVYGAARCLDAGLSGEGLFDWLSPEMLLFGTWIHLWYLPFAFLATMVASVPAIGGLARRAHGGALFLMLACVAMPLSEWIIHHEPVEPMPQWAFALPSALVGLALAGVAPGDPRGRRMLLACVGVAMLVAALLDIRWGDGRVGIPYAVGIPAAAFAWAIPGSAGPRLRGLADLTYGVYLVHPLIGSPLSRLGLSPDAVAIASVPLSFWSAWMLRRTPLGRFS